MLSTRPDCDLVIHGHFAGSISVRFLTPLSWGDVHASTYAVHPAVSKLKIELNVSWMRCNDLWVGGLSGQVRQLKTHCGVESS